MIKKTEFPEEMTFSDLERKNIEIVKSEKPTKIYTVFFVDDDLIMRKLLQKAFVKKTNLKTFTYTNGESCIKDLVKKPDIIVLDYHLSDSLSGRKYLDGLETLSKIKEKSPTTKVIMLSGQNAIDVAITCLKRGAVDYIVKDLVMNINLQKTFDKVIKSIELKGEIQALSQTIKRDKLLMRGYLVIILFMGIGLVISILN